MSAGRVILGTAMAGIAYLLWTQRSAAQEPEFQPAIYYTTQPAPQPQSRNYAPLLNWGLDTLMNWGKSSNTGGGFGWPSGTITNARAGDVSATAGAGFNLDSLLSVIGRAEAPGGYNTVYGGIAQAHQPPRPITTMTVGEVLAWQDRIDPIYPSEAAGRYQIMEDTLRDLVRQGHVRTDEYFDQATQDRLAVVLMNRRGLGKYQDGKISAETFANNLAKEWAGLPVVTGRKRGQSYYGGDGLNSAQVTPESVLASIKGGGWV